MTIEQGQNTVLLLCYSNVFSVFDVEGCACDLFVQGPGNQHPPREGFFLRGEVVRRQGRSISYYPVSPPGSSSFVRGARRHRTPLTLRVGGLFVSKGDLKLVKWRREV